MVVYLHGGGDGGGHPSYAARGGLPKQIEQGLTVPWVVLSPHCPNPPRQNRPSWSEYADEVVALVDEVRLSYPVDDTAVLLTGASMGGFGTWDLAARCPGRFAAAAPVSGGGDPGRADSLARLPFCVVHGAQDAVVPVERSLEMIRASADAVVRFARLSTPTPATGTPSTALTGQDQSYTPGLALLAASR